MIQIINTGVANIKSLQAAFDRLDQPWKLTESADDISNATHVVLPGVGAFAAAIESLDRLGLRDAIVARTADSGAATLCICLGMQLLCESSQESEGAPGLGVIPCRILRFPTDVPVPQLGWNSVTPVHDDHQGGRYYSAGEAYFANSFRLTEPPPEDWGYAQTDYGGQFISSVWRGRLLACQFHPELSGPWGQQLLGNWVTGTRLVNPLAGVNQC